MLPKLQRTNLSAVDPHGSSTTSLVFGGTPGHHPWWPGPSASGSGVSGSFTWPAGGTVSGRAGGHPAAAACAQPTLGEHLGQRATPSALLAPPVDDSGPLKDGQGAPPVRRGGSGGGPHTAISGHGDGGEAIGERTGGAKGAGSASSGLVMAGAKTTVPESSRTRVIPSRRSHPSCRTGAATVDSIKLALLGATRHRAGRASPAT
jgi:hypothetical protein